MKILFMDDDFERHTSFGLQVSAWLPPRVDSYRVWTGEAARDTMLAVPCFDALFLDHDLASEHYDEHRTGEPPVPGPWSGTDFVDWLVGDYGVMVPKKIVIHSWNRYGANRMATTLINRRNVDVRQVPFSGHLVTDVREWLVRA